MAWSDAFSKVFDGWNFLKAVVLILVATVCLYFLLVYGFFRALPAGTKSAKASIGKASTEILIDQVNSDGNHEYLIVVSPQGWQETGIELRQGDTAVFEAGGKVNVDLKGLEDSIDARRKAEKGIIDAETNSGRWEKEKSNFAPEDYFTANQKEQMIPHWHWIGPEGVPESEMDKYANPARRKRSILPGVGYGTLLAAVNASGVQPSQADVFAVGRSLTKQVTRDGKLYFTVNEVTNRELPELFSFDNIGFLYVRVTVSRPGSAK